MNMKTNEIRQRIRVVNQEMDNASCGVMNNLAGDQCEVALWQAVYDELLLERNQLEAELVELEKNTPKLSEEFEAASLDWAIRLASHPDREG